MRSLFYFLRNDPWGHQRDQARAGRASHRPARSQQAHGTVPPGALRLRPGASGPRAVRASPAGLVGGLSGGAAGGVGESSPGLAVGEGSEGLAYRPAVSEPCLFSVVCTGFSVTACNIVA